MLNFTKLKVVTTRGEEDNSSAKGHLFRSLQDMCSASSQQMVTADGCNVRVKQTISVKIGVSAKSAAPHVHTCLGKQRDSFEECLG